MPWSGPHCQEQFSPFSSASNQTKSPNSHSFCPQDVGQNRKPRKLPNRQPTYCGLLNANPRSRISPNLPYRSHVDVHTWMLCRTRSWTRVLLLKANNGTKEIAMFNADRGTAGNRWPVVRLRAGCSTEVVLLSPAFFALTTHFDRCTVPCAVDDCALCPLLPARGLFYLAVMCNSRVSLLELGGLSASNFEQHAKLLHGGMRPGLVFALSRRGQKSPVHSECIREVPSVSPITTLDLANHVLALYKFPPANPHETIESYEARVRSMAQTRNELAAQRITSRMTQRV